METEDPRPCTTVVAPCTAPSLLPSPTYDYVLFFVLFFPLPSASFPKMLLSFLFFSFSLPLRRRISVVRVLIDVAFAFLYFLSGVRGWLGNSLDLAHDPISADPWFQNLLVPLLMVAPLWMRFQQNLRRSYETRQRCVHAFTSLLVSRCRGLVYLNNQVRSKGLLEVTSVGSRALLQQPNASRTPSSQPALEIILRFFQGRSIDGCVSVLWHRGGAVRETNISHVMSGPIS